MKADFWLERWESGNTPFHLPEANAALVQHIGALDLTPGARVFVPLCGKTNDIGWLRERGFRVAGAELSPLAIEELFENLNLKPDVREVGKLKHYAAEGIDMFVGDIFALNAETLGPVAASYDRAALIALPPEMRKAYAAHMPRLTGGAKQLLLTIDYDQSKMDGPPFSVPEDEVQALYDGAYKVTRLARTEVPGGIKGVTPGDEIVWELG